MTNPESLHNLEFNPLASGWIDDPYPLYRLLQKHKPVHYSSIGAWVLSRHDDVKTYLADQRLSSRPSLVSSYSAGAREASSQFRMRQSLLPFLDPPEHTLLKALIRQAFNAETVKEITPKLRHNISEQAERAFANGSCDLLEDLVRPVCLDVVGDLLGTPESDRPKLQRWSRWFFSIFDPMPSVQMHEQVQQAIDEFRDYLGWILGERKDDPGNDIISRLLAVRAMGQRLSANDILSTALLIFSAGDENIVNLIGNSILALMTFPNQWELLCRLQNIPSSAIEELLRFAGPSQFTGRTALVDLDIHGELIHAGDVLLLLTSCANRDPEIFADPDQLDLLRPNNPHLAFGNGRHHCLGADLSRAELRNFLEVLSQKYPDLQLQSTNLRWKQATAVRGPENLPVSLISQAGKP